MINLKPREWRFIHEAKDFVDESLPLYKKGEVHDVSEDTLCCKQCAPGPCSLLEKAFEGGWNSSGIMVSETTANLFRRWLKTRGYLTYKHEKNGP